MKRGIYSWIILYHTFSCLEYYIYSITMFLMGHWQIGLCPENVTITVTVSKTGHLRVNWRMQRCRPTGVTLVFLPRLVEGSTHFHRTAIEWRTAAAGWKFLQRHSTSQSFSNWHWNRLPSLQNWKQLSSLGNGWWHLL